MSALAFRITPEYLTLIGELGKSIVGLEDSDSDPAELFSELPYMVLTPISPTEFNMKLMTEDEMFEAFKDDSKLEILN